MRIRERYKPTEVLIYFQVETLFENSPGEYVWSPIDITNLRVNGKFLSYSKDFSTYMNHADRLFREQGTMYTSTLAFLKEHPAEQVARKLAKVWPLPLRVMRMQKIRIQRPVGKIILPAGGI